MEEYKNFVTMYNKLSNIIDEIVEYVGGEWYERIYPYEDKIRISYCYRHWGEYDTDDITIPIEHVLNNTWKQYLEDEKKREQQEREEKEKRRQLYEELKQEFEISEV